ncbi:MAG: hypothetical protein RL678_1512 [Pseudomonadota bacterium]
MKKSFLAVLAVAALYVPWAAQAEESYVKVGVGQGQYKIPGDSERKTAFSLAFGQSLSENWGYELGYINFGKVSANGTEAGLDVRTQARTESLYAAAVGTLPLSESFSLFGKLGIAVNYTKFNSVIAVPNPIPGGPAQALRASESETKAKPMIGVGAAYNFSKQIAVTAEYQYFGKVYSDLKVDAWTVGLKYGF